MDNKDFDGRTILTGPEDRIHEAMREKVRQTAKATKEVRLALTKPSEEVKSKPGPGVVVDIPVRVRGKRLPILKKFKINAIGPNGEWMGEWL